MRKVYILRMQEELSYPVRAGQIKDKRQDFILRASPKQLADLAARFGLPAIARLEGRFVLQHERSGVIAAELAMDALVTQVCVLTLEPFDATIKDTASLRFVPEALLRRPSVDAEGDGGDDITPEALDSPDEIPYADDTIDLGAALAEQLALVLDPYPRKPGAVLPEGASDDSASPFAGLAARLGKPD